LASLLPYAATPKGVAIQTMAFKWSAFSSAVFVGSDAGDRHAKMRDSLLYCLTRHWQGY
jgi:hypothetical protein